MKKNLLVTIANKDYLLLAKQLFSSVYFNAGWKGDYMLLSCLVPEEDLKWFRQKGILIKEAQPFYSEKMKKRWAFNAEITTLKFFLFTPEFKKWKDIIYLDADIMVRASLDALNEVKGFAAVRDSAGPLLNQFVNENDKNSVLFHKLRKNYDLQEPSFNAGVMVFSTDIIKNDTFFQLKKIIQKYEKIRITSDQMCFNLLFNKKWQKLPIAYNSLFFVFNAAYQEEINKGGLKTIVLHFARGLRDLLNMNMKNVFYKEWRENLYKAELIDLNNVLPPKEIWTNKRIKEFEKKYRNIYNTYLKEHQK